jgi:16S rRNA (cytosine967-C5)-methyltransferase
MTLGTKGKYRNQNEPDLQVKALYEGPRGIAVKVLSRTESSDAYLEKLLSRELLTGEWSEYDRALLYELTFGVLRWQARLDWILTGFYHGEFAKCILPVKNAMRVALYQILMLSKIPPGQAISESVAIIQRIKDEKSGQVVAGVLKNILRNLENIRYPNKEENLEAFYSVTLSHPTWLVRKWMNRYGIDLMEKMMSANNERPLQYIRVNQLRYSTQELTSYLDEKSIGYEQSPYSPNYVRINGFADITTHEIWTSGKVTRMDVSNELLLNLAGVKQGMNIIDLGGINGYKSLVLAMMLENKCNINFVVSFKEQVAIAERQRTRLGLTCINPVDSDPALYETDQKADVVLADCPSSLLGLLCKKPYLKWKAEADAVRKNTKKQKAILTNAVKLCKPGGTILFTVMSNEPEETTAIVEWYLATFPNLELEPAENYIPELYCLDSCMMTTLALHKMDGMFAARFKLKG